MYGKKPTVLCVKFESHKKLRHAEGSNVQNSQWRARAKKVETGIRWTSVHVSYIVLTYFPILSIDGVESMIVRIHDTVWAPDSAFGNRYYGE